MEILEKLVLVGPNRRCECTVIEQQIVFTPAEHEFLSTGLADLLFRVKDKLESLGISIDEYQTIKSPDTVSQPENFTALFNAIVLSLQVSAGHRVDQSGYVLDSAGQGVWTWFEYEHDEVGEQASKLAFQLLSDADTRLQYPEACEQDNRVFQEQYRQFLTFAKKRVLPTDTDAIISAALALDVPCIKLERSPYEGVEGDFRIRPNGLLKLGHCQYQQLVDGTFCVTKNAALMPLVNDREAVRQKLIQMHVNVPRRDPGSGNCVMAKRAIRAADRIGYPVVVKPSVRTRYAGVSLGLQNAEQVREAVDLARRFSNQVIVESHMPGDLYQVLIVNHQLIAVLKSGVEVPLEEVHATVSELALMISSRWECAMMLVCLVTTDIGSALIETGAAVVDVKLAPELDRVLPPDSRLLDVAMKAFVGYLFPPGSISSVPIIAVTGTNGKTTTCRMITRIAQKAGKHTGMMCSDGMYIDEEFTQDQNDAGLGAHHNLLDNPNIDFTVFEEYFGRIARVGFPYAWSDIAVCTNVTEDHIGRIGANSLEQMAELKFTVPERARIGVVLNADDPRCLAMTRNVTAKKICLISTYLTPEEMRFKSDRPVCFCVLQQIDNKTWLTIIDNTDHYPVTPIEEIPATISGTAKHNIYNAMSAAAAAYLSDFSVDLVRIGLSSFTTDFDQTPGRLNIFDQLPFRVVMDYAHNSDGFRNISNFVDSQPVNGRKILMVGFTDDRQDKAIKAAVASLAGHFDHYVCRNFRKPRNKERAPEEIPKLLKSGFISMGIEETAISMVPDADEAVRYTLDFASPGDLVVLLVGSTEFQRVWGLLNSLASSDR